MDFILDLLFDFSAEGILEIYSIGGAPYLIQVLTGVSNLVYSAAFNALLATVALVGFLVLLAQGAANPRKFNYMWLFILAGIYYGAILPRTEVRVADTVMGGYTEVVADVPLVIALPAAFFSNVSLWFTREVEVQFNLPSEISYSNSGFLLGQELIADLQTLRFPDQRVADNYSEFWRTCVFYDIALGLYRWEQVVEASQAGGTALVDFIGDNTSVARQFSYKPGAGDSYITPCRQGWTGPMAQDLFDQRVKMYRTKHYKFFPGANHEDVGYVDDETGELIGSYAASMPTALSYYANISQSASQMANTAILGNSLREGLGNIAGNTDVDAATQEYALSKAQLERNNSFAVMGRVAAKFLPVLRNVFEALAYAVAPIVILMLVLPVAGKVFMGYMKVLAWINLWNPFYALLHSIMAFYSSNVAQGLTSTESGGSYVNSLSFINFTQLSQTMNEHSLLAGYLSLSVPMMAWMVVSMSGAMMAGLASRTMQGYDGSVQRASTEITSGNIKMGSLDYGNSKVMQEQLAPTTDSHRASWYDPTTGMTTTMDAGGRMVHEQAMSNMAMSLDMSKSMSMAAKDNFSKSTGAVLDSAHKFESALTESVGQGEMYASKSGAAYMEASGSANSMAMGWFKEQGWSSEKVTEMSGSAGVNSPAALMVASAGLKANAGVSEADREVMRKAEQFSSSSGFQNSLSAVRDAAAAMQAEFSGKVDDKTSQALQSSLQQNVTAQRQYENAEQIAAGVELKGTDGALNYLESNGILSRNAALDLADRANRGDPAAKTEWAAHMYSYAQSTLADMGAKQWSADDAVTAQVPGAESIRGAHAGGNALVDGEAGSHMTTSRDEVLSGAAALRDKVTGQVNDPQSLKPEGGLLGSGSGGGKSKAFVQEIEGGLESGSNKDRVLKDGAEHAAQTADAASGILKEKAGGAVQEVKEKVEQKVKESVDRVEKVNEEHGTGHAILEAWASGVGSVVGLVDPKNEEDAIRQRQIMRGDKPDEK